MSWEYQLVEVSDPMGKAAVGMLNSYGSNGWEAFAVTRHESGHWTIWTYHMKRQTPVTVAITAETKGKDPKDHEGDHECG